MTQFVIHREAGPAWTPGKGALEQPGVADHSAFMGELAEQGFLLVAGPLAGTERDRVRALLVVEADDEADVHAQLANDPWQRAEMLRTVDVQSWNVFVGAERFTAS